MLLPSQHNDDLTTNKAPGQSPCLALTYEGLDEAAADQSQGDRLSVGNIEGSEAVAIGRGAKAVSISQRESGADAVERHNRDRMLERVYASWIEGVLDKSVHAAP